METEYYLPRRDDHFPKLRRGHGTTHPTPRYRENGTVKVREMTECVDPTCSMFMPKSKNLHIDKSANLRDWCEERGLSMKHRTAGEAMVEATSGLRR